MKKEKLQKPISQKTKAISIIGCGNMGAAFAEKLAPTENLYFYDHHPKKSKELANKKYGTAVRSFDEAVNKADIIILAIKPQSLQECASSSHENISANQLLISLLSSTTLAALKVYFPHCHLVRMMPNLPLLCGEGMMGLCCHESERIVNEKTLGDRFDPLGKSLWLPESKMDAFTALAGSGPAFIFAVAEAIIEAGIAMGFSSASSREITFQMMRGSVALLDESRKHPGELKWQVTSPAGITIAGLKVFEEKAVRSGLMNAFLATYQKTKE